MIASLKYLMNELKFKTSEWSALPDNDKDDLKRWANEEQEAIATEQK
jgi:hypothetical protein